MNLQDTTRMAVQLGRLEAKERIIKELANLINLAEERGEYALTIAGIEDASEYIKKMEM